MLKKMACLSSFPASLGWHPNPLPLILTSSRQLSPPPYAPGGPFVTNLYMTLVPGPAHRDTKIADRLRTRGCQQLCVQGYHKGLTGVLKIFKHYWIGLGLGAQYDFMGPEISSSSP